MSFEWDKTKSAALKVLGKDGDVPDPPATIAKKSDEFDKAFDQFKKTVEELEKNILALEDVNDSMKNTIKQFKAGLDKSDFGLNAKSKDDAKKIATARKIVVDRAEDAIKKTATNEKILDELDKHLVQLQKYKSPPS